LNAHIPTVNVDQVTQSVLSLLGEACDTALARNDFQSPDDLGSALVPCYHATTWIECRTDASEVPYGVVCPEDTDKQVWISRFSAVNRQWLDMNGQLDLYSVSFAIAHLQSSKDSGLTAGAQHLQYALSNANPELDFSLASYLAAFHIASYGGTAIADYTRNYSDVLHYEYQADDIAWTALYLGSGGAFKKQEVLDILSQLYNDTSVSVGAKLYVEEIQYELDAL
jgi:hypothetical protein